MFSLNNSEENEESLFFKKKRLRLFDTASLTSVNVYLFSVCVMMNKQLLRAFPSPNGYKDSDSTFRSPNSFDESPETLNELDLCIYQLVLCNRPKEIAY